MDYSDLFVSRELLLETGRNQFFKNIVYISREDKEYLKLIGKGMFDGFDSSLNDKLMDLKKTSYLCKSLLKESQYQMEDYKEAYFKNEDDLINNKFENGMITEASVDSKQYKTTDSYKVLIRPENVILYFPVLENWVNYMLPKMENETFDTREIIKCISIPAKRWKDRRKMLLHLNNHDLIEHLV